MTEPRKLVYWPDAALKQPSRLLDVTDPDDRALIERLVPEMVRVMQENNGVGLSAVQIGEPVALIVVADNTRGQRGWMTFTNPNIIERHGEPRSVREGCLSVPGVFENVYRHREITFTSHLATITKLPMKLAADCGPCPMGCCDEPYCTDCDMHYAECDHPGPHGGGVTTEVIGQRVGGLLAHVIQHEVEHLRGMIFLDHVSGLRRARAATAMTRRKR